MNKLSLMTIRGIIVCVILVNIISSGFAVPKNDLVDRFAEILKFSADKKENVETKITPLFVRSSQQNSIELTMLIAYNRNITDAVRTITSEQVTPLIFSVSTMPFIETNFNPSLFCFEQDGIQWFPNADNNEFDMFPLGDNSMFGGNINDNQIQQGVILLPGIFDVTKPIKMSYKNFKKFVYLGR